jgi:NADH-quinone oxidoreductase subunit J
VIAGYPIHPEYANAQDIGLVLFTKYLIPFELAAVMLLVAMIGGIILAGKKMDTGLANENELDHHHSDFNKKETK